ncbi:MAG: hypothetical protein R3E02_06975 [Blastomonas sp.]
MNWASVDFSGFSQQISFFGIFWPIGHELSGPECEAKAQHEIPIRFRIKYSNSLRREDIARTAILAKPFHEIVLGGNCRDLNPRYRHFKTVFKQGGQSFRALPGLHDALSQIIIDQLPEIGRIGKIPYQPPDVDPCGSRKAGFGIPVCSAAKIGGPGLEQSHCAGRCILIDPQQNAQLINRFRRNHPAKTASRCRFHINFPAADQEIEHYTFGNLQPVTQKNFKFRTEIGFLGLFQIGQEISTGPRGIDHFINGRAKKGTKLFLKQGLAAHGLEQIAFQLRQQFMISMIFGKRLIAAVPE